MACPAIAALMFACAGASTPAPEAELPVSPVQVRLRTLNDKYVDLADLRGQALLISVIQTWADPALVEVPLLNQVADRYGDRLTILCVALDEKPEMVRIFVDTFKPEYEVVRVDDPERFTGESGPFGPIAMIPTSILLDASGRVAARMDGTWRPQVLRDALRRLLGPPSPRR